MTEVVVASPQPRHRSAPTGPLTRSAMAASLRPAGAAPAAAGQHGSETSPAAPLSSSSGPPPPHEPSAESPRRSITKKRAASINTEEANRPKIENLSLTTPSTASPRPFDASGGLICLCTPAPKVPRPRNAFILYRQHHQAQVVQQNPGLANPEISKIIGEQWREEPEERKNQWKLLAEEEKQHHQRKYPDYRYQPRRGNKGAGSESTRPAAAPGEDPHRCSKCGGRFIATPRTPSTPLMTPTATKPGNTPYGPPAALGRHPSVVSRTDMSRHSRGHPLWSGPQSAPNMYDIHEDYESAMSPNEAKRRRHNAAGAYHNFHALPSSPTPFTPAGHYPSRPRHPSLSYPHPSAPASYAPPPPALPGPSSMLPRSSPRPGPGPDPGPGPMNPPPRPSHSMPVLVPVPGANYHPATGHPLSSHPRNNNNNNNNSSGSSGSSGNSNNPNPEFDESLRLPPLQTHLPMSTLPDDGETSTGTGLPPTGLGILNPNPAPTTLPSYVGGGGGEGGGPAVPVFGVVGTSQRERERDTEAAAARSVEAMVMSIPFVNKLRVLERISPPLPATLDTRSGTARGRGPVIAVEGSDGKLVRAVAGVVERALRAAGTPTTGGQGGWEVRCWEDDGGGGEVGVGGEDVAMVDAGPGSRQGSRGSIAAAAATSSGSGGDASASPFTTYLRTITDWHAKSAEIVKFVTTTSPTNPARQTRLTSTSSTSTTSTSTTDSNKTSPDTTPRPTKRRALPPASGPHPTTGSPPPANPNPTPDTTPTAGTTTNRLPIALLPAGFSLTLADRFACAVPIADAYAPVDHWQWMATLWRGIVGADLVVYVAGGSAVAEEGASVLGTAAGTVEVRGGGLIVVRVPGAHGGSFSSSGSGSGSGFGVGNGRYGEGGKEVEGAVDEKMERRLGFEVVEWVRGGGWNTAPEGEGQVGMEY